MVLHLAEQLDVPLRERNDLLLAAGYAPVYAERGARRPAHGGGARRRCARCWPATSRTRPWWSTGAWNLVDANASVALFTAGVGASAAGAAGQRAAGEPASRRAWRRASSTWASGARTCSAGCAARWRSPPTPDLAALYDELRAYPCDQPEPEVELPGPGDVVVPLRTSAPGGRSSRSSAPWPPSGHPLDVTVAELAIESFFPADAATARFLQGQLGAPSSAPST